MKTLHLTNAYHPTSGGVRTFYHALFEHANRVARPMRLIVPSAETRVETVGEHGLIYHVRARQSPAGDNRYRLLLPCWESGREIRRILRAEKPDLVEISDKYTLPLLAGFLRKGWLRGIPRPFLVATSHERMDATTASYFGRVQPWLFLSRILLKQLYFPVFDVHIANSAYTAAELLPASIGHRPHREIRVLPMGVDAASITPNGRSIHARAALAELAGVPSDAILLLYAGRLAAEKNLAILIGMIERLPEGCRLLLAGDGPLRPWLEAHANRSRDRIRILGHVPQDRIPQLYGGATAFVHPNPREPFGIAPLEAMAAGLPLVAPNAGGVLSYASAGNAWLADATPEGFASAVTELLQNPEECDRRVRRARTVAENHDWPRIAERYFAFFDELVSEMDVRLGKKPPICAATPSRS